MKLLMANQLCSGDIMLKAISSRNVFNLATNILQSNQTNSHIVHAGIMGDCYNVIEAQTGLVSNDIRFENKHVAYFVFRAIDPGLAEGIGTFAKVLFDTHKEHKVIPYGAFKAISSIFRSRNNAVRSINNMEKTFDGLFNNRSFGMFCSQFAVFAIHFVAESNNLNANLVLPISDRVATPARLCTALKGSRYFTEIGYMLPGRRIENPYVPGHYLL